MKTHLADWGPPEPPLPCVQLRCWQNPSPHLQGFLGFGHQCGENLALENGTVTSLGVGRCFLCSVTSSTVKTDASVCLSGRGGLGVPWPWSPEGHHSPGHLQPPSVVGWKGRGRGCPARLCSWGSHQPAPAVIGMKHLSPMGRGHCVDPGSG